MRENQNSGFGISKTRGRSGYSRTIFTAIYILFLVVFVSSCEQNQQTDPSLADPLKAAGISEILPGNLADSVPIDPIVSVVFKEGTSEAKVSGTSITLKKGSEIITGLLTYSGTTASFSTETDLAPESNYTATVKTYQSGDSDDSESSEYTWQFRTGNHHRDNGLAVVSVLPLRSATDVPVTTSLAITFNQDLTYSMKRSVSIMLKMGSNIVAGVVSYSGKTGTFKPNSSLTSNTVYTGIAIIGSNNTGDNDKSGNYYTWTFTTAGSGADVTAPVINSVVPANNAASVLTSSNASVTFSEAMNPATLTSGTFTLKQGSTSVAGSVAYSGTTATFTPSAALASGTVYTGTITTGAKDAAGNALASNYTWSFTTAAGADVTAPTVLSAMPANNATAVPTNTKATVTFSEAMNAATITATSFNLKQGTTVISGTVTYTGTTATFTTASALAANTVYTGSVTTAAKDAAGNALASDYTWSFTTAAAADLTAPTVSSVTPAANATSVASNSKATATFSEAMNSSTITSSTFTLKQGSTSVAGTVTYSGTTATFTPSAALAGGTVYTGTITTGAKDAAGNALASNYSWSFTTVVAADVTAPTVNSVTPAANATSVAVTSKATATFSEAMNSTTITSSTFTLKQGSTSVAGTVTLSGNTATFTPSAALTGGTVYTGTITTGAKDAAGNSIASNYSWSFTTVVTAPAGKSFSADVVPILTLCNTCHTHPWTTSTNASTFYTNLVNGGYVNPTSPTTSKIYTKLSGGHPGSTVTAAQVTTILTWMTEGSKNN